MDWWSYDNLETGAPYDWTPASRGNSEYDAIDFHLDLGCGKLKKGRIGIDRYPCAETDLIVDLETLTPSEVLVPDEFEEVQQRTVETFNARIRGEEQPIGLPFPTSSIESIVSHHCLEHIGDGFLPLMDECYRVLVPGGVMRVIVPLFPSRTAVEDPDHRRMFMTGSFDSLCGTKEGVCWLESFSVPYTDCRFEMVDRDYTKRLEDPTEWWGPDDARELRVALRKHKEVVADAGAGQIQVSDPVEDSARDHTESGGASAAEGVRELAGVA